MAGTVRLLDRLVDAVKSVPPGSVHGSDNPYDTVTSVDHAEWVEGAYRIWIKFEHGRVNAIDIARADDKRGVKPDPGLAMRFAPQGINPGQTTSTVSDATAIGKSVLYEWAYNGDLIRLAVSSYGTRTNTADAGDLEGMRWSVTPDPKQSKDLTFLLQYCDKLTGDLERLGRQLDAARDLRGGFIEMHVCMARGINEMARARKFSDPVWVLRLNIAFIDAFFEEWQRWKSNPTQSPEAWRKAFEVAQAIQVNPHWPEGYDERVARDRVILLMAGAHILHDIPVCLNRVGCGPESDFRAIESVIDSCEKAKLGNVGILLKDIGVWLNYPGANSIKDWRNAVWNYVCRHGPHPSQIFKPR